MGRRRPTAPHDHDADREADVAPTTSASARPPSPTSRGRRRGAAESTLLPALPVRCSARCWPSASPRSSCSSRCSSAAAEQHSQAVRPRADVVVLAAVGRRRPTAPTQIADHVGRKYRAAQRQAARRRDRRPAGDRRAAGHRRGARDRRRRAATSSSSRATASCTACAALGEDCAIAEGKAVARAPPAAAPRGARAGAVLVPLPRRQTTSSCSLPPAQGRGRPTQALFFRRRATRDLQQRALAPTRSTPRCRARPRRSRRVTRSPDARARQHAHHAQAVQVPASAQANQDARAFLVLDPLPAAERRCAGAASAPRCAPPRPGSTASTSTRGRSRCATRADRHAPWLFRLPWFCALRRLHDVGPDPAAPRRWPRSPSDLICHELCHVWQMQHRPRRDAAVLPLPRLRLQPVRAGGAPRASPRLARARLAAARACGLHRRRSAGRRQLRHALGLPGARPPTVVLGPDVGGGRHERRPGVGERRLRRQVASSARGSGPGRRCRGPARRPCWRTP